MKRTFVASAVLMLLAGCSSPDVGSQAKPIGDGVAVTAAPNPHPTLACELGAAEAATKLVRDFDAVALLRATVSQAPQAIGDANPLQMTATPLEQVQVLAGVVSNGQPTALVIQDAPGTVFLAPGSYFIAVNETAYGNLASGQYMPAGGLLGTFELSGSVIAQRCPDYADPQHPLHGPALGPGEIVAAFQRALGN